MIGMIEGFFGWFEIFDFGIFWEEKVWQVVFELGSLIQVRIFWVFKTI